MAYREVCLSTGDLRVAEGTALDCCAGATLWDAGIVLAQFLSNCDSNRNPGGFCVRGKRVIELGCGTGAVGLSASLLGASSVLLTDLPELLPLAAENLELNRAQLRGEVAVEALPWGSDVARLRPPYDAVLCSDVLYQAEALQPLLATLRALSDGATRILLSNEHRPALPFPRAAFEAAGLAVQEVPPEEQHPAWCSDDIQIYAIRLAECAP